jgi:excisionase family DNA binding protein
MQEQLISFYGMPPAEFLEAVSKVISKVVEEEIRKALHSSPSGEHDQHFYTVQETASYLSVTRQTVHEYVRQGKLRVYKMGARSYFMRADILAALQSESYLRTPKASRSHGRR